MPTMLLIVLAIPITLIILSVIFRKQIRLKLLQMLHTKYSYEYVTQFKKYTNKSPFPYCFKDDILPYLRLINNKKKEILTIESAIPYKFENSDFGEIKEIVLKDQPKPDCFNIFRIGEAELRAYGFEENSFDTQLKTVFFFLGNSLVMGEYIMDSSNNIDNNKILATYISKDALEQIETKSKFLISCADNTSILYYDNGFTTTVRFVDLKNQQLMNIVNR